MLPLKFMEQLSVIILVEWKSHSWLIKGNVDNYHPPEISSFVTTATNYQSHWWKVNEKVARSPTCASNRRCGRSGLLWIIGTRSKWPEMLIFIARTEICRIMRLNYANQFPSENVMNILFELKNFKVLFRLKQTRRYDKKCVFKLLSDTRQWQQWPWQWW